jgi:hypothetical protein
MRKALAITAVLAALLATAALFSSPASAGTGTVTTDDQLWVNQSSPTSSNCTTWSSVFGGTTAQKRTIVSFPTAGVVPAGQTVTAATLRIYAKANYSGNNVSVKSYTRGTIGCNLTWNNLGTVGAQIGLSSGNFAKNTYKSITLDPASVSTSGRTAYVLDATAASLMEFRSDASGSQLNPSKLDLTWAPAATTTTVAPTTTTVAPTTTTVAPTTTTTAPPTGCTGVTVTDGADIQAAIDANPAGTTFCIEGSHRVATEINPKQDDVLWGVFIGGTPASLNGSKLLTSWTASGSDWWAPRPAGASGQSPNDDRCAVSGCDNRHDVFYDGTALVRATSLAGLAPGKFYEDFAANRVYIRDNPSGHTVEQAFATHAIRSTNTGITVKNLVVEKVGNQAQEGAIDDQGANWVIEYNDVRYNHGHNVHADANGSIIRRNKIHHSMQMGFGGTGDNLTMEYNEINHNNRDNSYDAGWEGGGGKWAETNQLTMRGNWSHHNNGVGLWTDINNINTLYENNYLNNNTEAGIEHEISYAATIRNNVSVDNSPNATTAFYQGGQIQIAESPDVEVYGNTVRGRDGIGGRAQNRGTGTFGPWEIHNLNVHDNDIEVSDLGGWHLAAAIVSDDASQQPAVWTSWNNHYEANDYFVPTTDAFWDWSDSLKTWAQWQALGHDDTGTRTVGGHVTVPPPPTLTVGPQP